VRKLLLLRPEPGLSASAARAAELGLDVVAYPLFRIEPVEWSAPDARQYDALLVTSANAMLQAGPQLAAFRSLPVYAVGRATADAARQSGFAIAGVGNDGVDALLAGVPGSARLLHLAGEQRRDLRGHRQIDAVTVYRSVAKENLSMPQLANLVVAIHSPRAGARLAELVLDRGAARIAAISAAAAEACGAGWEDVAVADRPDDPSLLALAASLCHTSAQE